MEEASDEDGVADDGDGDGEEVGTHEEDKKKFFAVIQPAVHVTFDRLHVIQTDQWEIC